jgi:hypothetical protein
MNASDYTYRSTAGFPGQSATSSAAGRSDEIAAAARIDPPGHFLLRIKAGTETPKMGATRRRRFSAARRLVRRAAADRTPGEYNRKEKEGMPRATCKLRTAD